MMRQDVFQARMNAIVSALLTYDSGQGFGPKPYQLATRAQLTHDLTGFQHIAKMREEIIKIPMDKDHVFIRTDWHIFPAGTRIVEIEKWFEHEFNIAFRD